MRLVCENHPTKAWPDECDCGPGMNDPIEKIARAICKASGHTDPDALGSKNVPVIVDGVTYQYQPQELHPLWTFYFFVARRFMIEMEAPTDAT